MVLRVSNIIKCMYALEVYGTFPVQYEMGREEYKR